RQGNLFRNKGLLDYPYPIGDAGKITTSSFGDQYYYFFYDWKIKKEDFECISERTAVDVILSASEEIENEKGLSIFPNPTNGLLFVDLKENAERTKLVRLLDINGREVFRQILSSGFSFQIDLNQLPTGF